MEPRPDPQSLAHYHDILDAVLRLTELERRRMIGDISASLPDDFTVDDEAQERSEEWQAEIARRVAELDAGAKSTKPPEDVS